MKKINQIASSVIALFGFFAFTAHAQLKTPAPSPTQTLDQAFALSNIKIEYSRPRHTDPSSCSSYTGRTSNCHAGPPTYILSISNAI